jgi:hypothetical protein
MLRIYVVLFVAVASCGVVRAEGLRTGLDPGLQCRAAIRAAEAAAGIPEHLMAAIGRVESGRLGADGRVNPWPWSINAEGTDYVYDSKPEVIRAVQALQAKGVRSIDVGCMQVNLLHHPRAFASLEEAFDPVANARYAARFLLELKGQTGSWDKATAWYHSATPELGEPYQRKVMAVWPEEKRRGWAENWRGGMGPGWGAVASYPQPGGGYMLGNHGLGGRLAGLPPNGRGLDSYRARPLPLAGRPMVPAPLSGG